MKPFLLTLSVFWILKVSIWMICTVAISLFFLTDDPTISVEESKMMIGVMAISLLPTALIVYAILSLVGTILPAAAALQDTSFGQILVTGRSVFWRTYGNLLLGNGLFSAGSLLLSVFILQVFDESEVLGLGQLLYFCWELTAMFGMLLTATALCIAYESGQLEKTGA